VSVMSQEQQHELPPEEGGGRLNWLLAVLVLVVAMVMGIVLAAGVQSSGVSTQPSASSDSGSGSDTADKGEIADLVAHDGRTVRPPAPVPLPIAPVNPPPIVSQRTPHSPSAFEQWARQKYMKALESPEVVAAFHSTTLEVPQARTQGGGSDLSPGDAGSGGAAQVHPAPSPYTITAGNVIPALLVSGIDSDLPGPIVAQVRESVFDTATGRYMLIPQGSKLLGSYQNASAYGQQRVQIAWQRLISPTPRASTSLACLEPIRAVTQDSRTKVTITICERSAPRS
jgi:type F conjugative transfer system protein TrbI